MDAPVGEEVFSWRQNGSKRGNYGKMIREGMKSARMEDIWYVPIEKTAKKKGLTLKQAVRGMEMLSMMDSDVYWEDDYNGC